MSYPNTPVLGLQVPDTAGDGLGYGDRLGDDQQLSSSLTAIDTFAGNMTGSACFTMFCPASGSVMDLSPGGTDAAAGVLGVEYNRSCDRVIQEVVAFVAASGSNPAAVARVDVGIQQGTTFPANFGSIFTNAVFKPVISGSTGAYTPAKASTFVSGTNTVWRAGTLLKANVDLASGIAAGLGAMRGLTVQVFWKPTGSYGA